MPKKPFYRAFDDWWYAQLRVGGKRIQKKLVKGNANEADAYRAFCRLMPEHDGKVPEHLAAAPVWERPRRHHVRWARSAGRRSPKRSWWRGAGRGRLRTVANPRSAGDNYLTIELAARQSGRLPAESPLVFPEAMRRIEGNGWKPHAERNGPF
jgi:hypothetical protein